MDKNEFMNQLREGLDGNVSYEKYRETIEYYEAYFRRRMAEGKTEQEIVAELGFRQTDSEDNSRNSRERIRWTRVWI